LQYFEMHSLCIGHAASGRGDRARDSCAPKPAQFSERNRDVRARRGVLLQRQVPAFQLWQRRTLDLTLLGDALTVADTDFAAGIDMPLRKIEFAYQPQNFRTLKYLHRPQIFCI
jgi:hypothetical protein